MLGLDRGARRLRRLGLLRRLAARALGCTPGEIGFDREEAGALLVVEPRPLCVSAAGRDGWSVIAVAHAPIGVDIDAARPTGPLPVDLLHPAEQARINAERPDDRPGAFARIWIAKEAYVKASALSLDAVLGLETKVRRDRLFFDGVEVVFRSRPPMLAAAVVI